MSARLTVLCLAICATLAVPVHAQRSCGSTGCIIPGPIADLSRISSVAAAQLSYDFTVNPYTLVDASIRFSDDKTKQKLSISPLKFRNRPDAWDGLTLAIVNGGGATTLSGGLTYDWAAAYSTRRDSIMAQFNRADLPVVPEPLPNETEAAYAARNDSILIRIYDEFWQSRLRHAPSITISGSVQSFSPAVASEVDLDNDDVIDNAHLLKARVGSIEIGYRWSMWTAFSLAANYGRRRVSAAETADLQVVRGASLTASRVVGILRRDYLFTKEYRTKLYVPSVAIGASVEWQRCSGPVIGCDNRIREQRVLTPFLDVRLPAGAQFRLGAPVRRDDTGDKTGTRIEPLLQFSWAMAAL